MIKILGCLYLITETDTLRANVGCFQVADDSVSHTVVLRTRLLSMRNVVLHIYVRGLVQASVNRHVL